MNGPLTPELMEVQKQVQELLDLCETQHKVLEWYAADGNWKRPTRGRHWSNSPACEDKGSRARAVLFGLEDGQ